MELACIPKSFIELPISPNRPRAGQSPLTVERREHYRGEDNLNTYILLIPPIIDCCVRSLVWSLVVVSRTIVIHRSPVPVLLPGQLGPVWFGGSQ